MQIRKLEVGPLATNCYIVWCQNTKEALVIDPGEEGEKIFSIIQHEGIKVKEIVNTHCHWDHVSANSYLIEKTGARLAIHKKEAEALMRVGNNLSKYMGRAITFPDPDRLLSEGDIIEVGNSIRLKVLHTPGHSPGSICLPGEDVMFCGDTVFAGSIGRTDLPGGSYQDIMASIKNKIIPLKDSLTLYPGHGPKTTIGAEKKYNPFFQN